MVDNSLILTEFRGPLFLIGMPRSGTKLLRSLLNEHRIISIPDFETEFFPYWVKHWHEFSDLSIYENFKRFYSKMLNAPYFVYCKNAGVLIDMKTWFDLCESFTPSSVFEALIRHDVGASIGENVVWGDKSPSYIESLQLIKQQFPNAKFIHIVRDVCDYCLSINHAWNKNMIRAAQRWNDNVAAARLLARPFISDYIEVRYEDLIEQPEIELNIMCEFMGISFDVSMLKLSKPSENIGATKGQFTVVSSNKNKYLDGMSEPLRKRIESISYQTLISLDYPVSNVYKEYRVPGYKMSIYKLLDGFNLFVTTIQRIGFYGTVKYVYGALKVSNK